MVFSAMPPVEPKLTSHTFRVLGMLTPVEVHGGSVVAHAPGPQTRLDACIRATVRNADPTAGSQMMVSATCLKTAWSSPSH